MRFRDRPPTDATRDAAPPAWLALGWLKALLILWALTLTVCLTLGADGILRSARQGAAAADLIARLHLTAPAYYPAGHPLRHPEARQAGIPDPHAPGLPPWLGIDREQMLPPWRTQP